MTLCICLMLMIFFIVVSNKCPNFFIPSSIFPLCILFLALKINMIPC